MAVSLVRKLWRTEEYEEMIEKGVLDKYDHVELIRGEIVEMAPIGLRHAYCVASLDALLHGLVGRSATVFTQTPIQLPNNSMPEPDVALVRGPLSSYARRRVTAEDVILFVEVSDTTLATDRRVKLPLYAEAGIPEVWIGNVDEDLVDVYSQLANGKYKAVHQFRRGETVPL